MRFARDILLIFLAALLISFLIKTFLIRSFYIPSESMEQTLVLNDRIIVNELTPDLVPISRGDVIVFQDPGNWLQPQPVVEKNPLAAAIDSALGFVGLSATDSNDHLIKRVIGLPGDHVICCDEFGRLTVNGTALEEPYTQLKDGFTDASPETFDIVVPEDSLWVMGDNRYQSADSAYHHANEPGHEYVPYDDVVGRAFVVSWPLSRWAWLDNYPLVFSDVEDASN
ncbi:signal peptidase I [Glaciihabitans tibetensis]|uniref:Signal peptidase I n=2 Tax=Glaciihabitans tibetensis TaxID=1266600 RepID=A0A2T0VI85_9MICO|nr:signal peptidase I [Glaciihabitans tibetensis]